MLELQNISFAYKQRAIFNGFNLTLQSGETVLITGTNGSGKTTLLNICSGYLSAQNGDVMLASQSINKFAPQQRAQQIVMLSAALNNNHPFTARQLIKLGCYAFNLSHQAENNLADRVIDELGIQALQNAKLAELSQGQQRLVAIGRFLAQCYPAMQPQVLLCDEPFNYLDVANLELVRGLLLNLVAQKQAAMLIATHDLQAMPQVQRIEVKTSSLTTTPDHHPSKH